MLSTIKLRNFFVKDKNIPKLAGVFLLTSSLTSLAIQMDMFPTHYKLVVGIVVALLTTFGIYLQHMKAFSWAAGLSLLYALLQTALDHAEPFPKAKQWLGFGVAALSMIVNFTGSTPASFPPTPSSTTPLYGNGRRMTFPRSDRFGFATVASLLGMVALFFWLCVACSSCVRYDACIKKFGDLHTDTLYTTYRDTLTVPRDSAVLVVKTHVDSTHVRVVNTYTQGRATATIIREPTNTTVIAQCKDSTVVITKEVPTVNNSLHAGVNPFYKIAFWGLATTVLFLGAAWWLSRKFTVRSPLLVREVAIDRPLPPAPPVA